MKKVKKNCIAIFSGYIPPHVGGVERYTANMVKQFVNLGYQPIVVTCNYSNDEEFEVVDDVVIIRLPIFEKFKNRYPIVKLNKQMNSLMKKLDNYDIETVIVNTRFHLTTHIGVGYANGNKIPVYLVEHVSDYVTVDNKFIDFFANRYEDLLTLWLKKRVDGYYGVSAACEKWLCKLGLKTNGIWYNSIDFSDEFSEKTKHKEVNFLYAGRLIKQKGVYNILVSFSNLALKYDNIYLYIAGDGAELEGYKNKFVHERIHFLGRLEYSELLDYYRICDIFLYPPLWPEGLPTSILEAGMTKCAVIATDQGGIKEIIQDNKNGIIVSGDVNDLERAMEELLLDSKLRDKLAMELYKIVKNKFSWDVTAKKILNDIKLDKKKNVTDRKNNKL